MDISGEMFCSMFDANIVLDFSQSPAAGSVKMMCSGECSGEATAPVEANKTP